MLWLNSFSDAAFQEATLIAEDGSTIDFTLFFASRQNSWFFNISCAAQDFTANGVRLCNSPNLLRQWKNNITFGLAVVSEDAYDPNNIEDLLSNRIQLFLLNAADVQTVEQTIYAQDSQQAL